MLFWTFLLLGFDCYYLFKDWLMIILRQTFLWSPLTFFFELLTVLLWNPIFSERVHIFPLDQDEMKIDEIYFLCSKPTIQYCLNKYCIHPYICRYFLCNLQSVSYLGTHSLYLNGRRIRVYPRDQINLNYSFWNFQLEKQLLMT